MFFLTAGAGLAVALLPAALRFGPGPLAGLSASAWPTSAAEDRLPVQLTVTNRSRWPALSLTLQDDFPADRDTQKRAVLERARAPDATETVPYTADCSRRRGGYAIGPLTAVSSDPLGIFSLRREFPVLSNLTVMPRLFSIDRLPLEGRSRWDSMGQRASLKAGSALNFFGTRDYRHGDSLRFIHWPSTARQNRLIVKEFETDISSEVTILLDLHYYTLKGSGRETTLDYAVRIAASIARHAIHGANQVQVIGQGKELLHVPAGSGEFHLLTILDQLSKAAASGDTPLEDLLLSSIPLMNGGSTLVVVFNSVNLDLTKYVNALTILRAKGIRILAVLIDDNTFLNLWEGVERKKVGKDRRAS